jgi:polygalacturonase
MERKKFLTESLIGASILPFMASNNPSNKISPQNKSQSVFNVYDYGAEGNGKILDTNAIQQAIDACHKAGGGTVTFPAGHFLTGTLFLKSFVFLKLEPQATLLGSTKLSDFDSKHRNFIYANKIQHSGIIGQGMINGQGDSYWHGKDRPYHRPPKFILFEKSTQITLHGIKIINTPSHCIEFGQCKNVHADSITIINDHKAPNTDGIDPKSSTNVFISNCYIDTGDDAICLKASRDSDGATENVVVTNCIISSDDSALKCGTSDHADIKNCVFNNIIIRNSTIGIAFFIKDGKSNYENIQFSNINIATQSLSDLSKRYAHLTKDRLSHCYPIFMDIEPRTPHSGLGSIRNISFNNIHIDTWNGNCLIAGWKGRPIKNISIENLHTQVHSRASYEGRTKPRGTRNLEKKAANDLAHIPSHFTFANIDNLTLKNVTVEDVSEEKHYHRHEIWGIRATDVDLNNISYSPAPADKKTSAIDLKNCENVLINESRAPVSDTSFIRFEGKKTKNINVIGNNFYHAKRKVDLKDVDKETLFKSANRKPNTDS